MKILKWHIVSQQTVDQAEQYRIISSTFAQYYRWFSGWKDLDIIWECIRKNTPVDQARSMYADARGTDEYGYERN